MKNIFKKLYNFINSWTGTIIIVLAVIFFIAQAFIIPSGSMLKTMLIGDNLFVKKFSYGIPTPTIPWLEIPIMPDFNKNGHLIEGKRPERGDIVIFRYPLEPKIHYVKRLVATPGDSVLYTKEGLWVHFSGDSKYKDENAKKIEFSGKTFYYEPYLRFHPGINYEVTNIDAFRQLQVLSLNGEKIAMKQVRLNNGEEAYFTQIAEDSFFMMGDNRNNSNDSRFWGAVDYRYIIGKPWFIYFSFDDNFNIRWNRMFKSIESIEKETLLMESKES
ncbi:MAG: signal peptidase I [Helicobacteraceae bacterium]|nr:signal peptidase I [Helicobacteraceae bacterium]